MHPPAQQAPQSIALQQAMHISPHTFTHTATAQTSQKAEAKSRHRPERVPGSTPASSLSVGLPALPRIVTNSCDSGIAPEAETQCNTQHLSLKATCKRCHSHTSSKQFACKGWHAEGIAASGAVEAGRRTADCPLPPPPLRNLQWLRCCVVPRQSPVHYRILPRPVCWPAEAMQQLQLLTR